MTYDHDNRLTSVSFPEPSCHPTFGCGTFGSSHHYGYSPDNKRVFKQLGDGTEHYYLWSGNQLLGAYQLHYDSTGELWQLNVTGTTKWLAGRRVGLFLNEDRLGSNTGVNATTKYYPYGEERTPNGQSEYKFATYYRENGHGLDYADQRWYSSRIGRFLTADPYVASGGVRSPASWNRYGYVGGDPVNFNDPQGLARCIVGVGEGAELVDCEILRIQVPPALISATAHNVLNFLASMQQPHQDSPKVQGAKKLAQTKQKLQNLKLTSDCADDLKALGVTEEEFRTYANSLKYIDGTSVTDTVVSAIYGKTPPGIIADATKQYGKKTVQQAMKELGAQAIAQINGHNLYVDEESFADSDMTKLGGVIMGELLHQMGFSHRAIGSRWQEAGRGLNADATHEQIEEKLNKDCFGVR
jgi:RHS repeat-associated protein